MNDVVEKGRAGVENSASPSNDPNTMSGQSLADFSEKTALTLCVFPHNARQPGADSSLARMFFEHLPTVASFDGATVSNRATILSWSARDMSRSLSQDIEAGRDIIGWLSPHLPANITEMFDKGAKSSLNPIFDRLAKEGGFQRDDILVREAQSQETTEKSKRQALFASASQFLGLGR